MSTRTRKRPPRPLALISPVFDWRPRRAGGLVAERFGFRLEVYKAQGVQVCEIHDASRAPAELLMAGGCRDWDPEDAKATCEREALRIYTQRQREAADYASRH